MNPQFFIDGFSRFDVNQGDLGDCWLLAAIASITMYKDVFVRVVPEDQNFREKYAGIFHFRFWQYGRWVDIAVDDRLPTKNGRLLYVFSTARNEYWCPLLEKAYAKLHGTYEALKGGQSTEAFEDFTGGLTEAFFLDMAPKDMFQIMLKSFERNSLLSSGIMANPRVVEEELNNGLIKGHAYSVTSVKLIELRTDKYSGHVPMVRLRNPWGRAEWSGAWSDRSREWQNIPDHEKKAIGLTFAADGEFWMSFADFMRFFSSIEICHFGPWTYSEEEIVKGKRKWQMYLYEGAWVRGVTAGGSLRHPETYCCNPQYILTLKEVDDNDPDKKCTVIISLLQKSKRSQFEFGERNVPIMLNVFKVLIQSNKNY